MLIVFFAIMALFAGLSAYVYVIINKGWGFLLMTGMLLSLIPALTTASPPVDKYPYEAVVTIQEKEKTIYFTDYVQDGNEVEIESYCKNVFGHWLDFKGYDVVDEPLKITLVNQKEFEYKVRATNDTNNSKQIATQP
jgi:hypothetical protein